MTKCEEIAPYFDLEGRSDRASGLSVTPLASLGRRWGKVKTAIATWIVQTSEPKVSQRRDCKGRVHYQLYDPRSNTFAAFGSEAEIRAWLEQRYYR